MQVVYDVGSWRITEEGRVFRRGKLRFANGDLYDGEWVDGKRHGQGTFTYHDGLQYRGEFAANLFEGFGVLVAVDQKHPITGVWVKGSTYEGEFRGGKKHGKGLMVFGEGGSYDGMFADNVFSGRGVRSYANGDRFDGEWKHGMWWGMGHLCRVDGESYVGECKRNLFHTTSLVGGVGRRTFRGGAGSYEGGYRHGLQHGKGLRVFADGSTYEGDWTDNVMQGSGVWTTAAFTYIGDFAHGRPHGHGLFTFTNGDVYEGSMRDGYFYGRGKFTFKDGSCGYGTLRAWNPDGIRMEFPAGSGNWYGGRGSCTYTGMFANGTFHGQGTLVTCDGRRYEGAWHAGKRHGQGRADLIPLAERGDEARMHMKGCNSLYRFASYDGMHENDKRQGFGTSYYSNGEGIEGTFKDGQVDGVATYIYMSGKRRRGMWIMGQRVSWMSEEDEAKWATVDKAMGRVIHDVELFRLTCSTLVTAVAFMSSWNAGGENLSILANRFMLMIPFVVVAFLHCMLHIFTALTLDGSWNNSSVVSTIILILRVFSFERLLSIALFPRMSYEAKLRENTLKLQKFFRLHDPSRVDEAESLLLGFVGNESLLFVLLRQKYAAVSQFRGRAS
ncbi:hypothetical protein DYB30_000666 [Aphanomyces astaci]|uniref:Uncharacterized protein n=2 Tax=Aphanomyces astaci TaxID=112090 RepID=A0A397E3N0_APHAT|nr:hypothetical protein DYB30_000666 [Aphanomyces astaci]